MNTLFVFGLGYTGQRIAEAAVARGWKVVGTKRSPFEHPAIECIPYDGTHAIRLPADTTHLLSTIAPDDQTIDAVITQHRTQIESLEHLKWVGYLSATSVYGNCDGAWVDESAPCHPTTERGKRRLQAEALWQSLSIRTPAHLFRLAGIYGPGRSLLDRITAGTARRIIKPGQVFSRIHVDDIVSVVLAAIDQPHPGSVYNCADDYPCSSNEIIDYVCAKHHLPLPPEIALDDPSLPAMVKSFYQDSRRIDNRKMKQQLNVHLHYPNYRAFYR